jgi:cell division cycle 2-like protein
LINNEPLITGASEIEQLNKMFRLLGTPNEKVWPGFDKLPHAQSFGFTHHPDVLHKSFPMITKNGMNILTQLLNYDPKQRISAEEALTHAYFSEEPKGQDPSLFPIWQSKSSRGRGDAPSLVDEEDALRRELGIMF